MKTLKFYLIGSAGGVAPSLIKAELTYKSYFKKFESGKAGTVLDPVERGMLYDFNGKEHVVKINKKLKVYPVK